MNEETDALRKLVNGGKYEEAFVYFQNLPQDRPECLRKLAIDTIFDAVTKFRDVNDAFLKALVMSLFDAIHPEMLKFRICFNFITSRSTPHLNEVLINQLGFIVNSDFRETHYEEWRQLRDVLPLKLEKNLPSESDANIFYPALEAAHILFFFKEIPFIIPERMSNIFTQAVNGGELELPTAFPLLVFHSKTHPFSPKLLNVTSPTVLIPSIYNRCFLGRRLMEGLIVYLQENEYNYERYFVKPVADVLNIIVKLTGDLKLSDVNLCCELILPLLRFVEDFDQHSFRVSILNKCEEIIRLFPSLERNLFLKRIIPQVLDNESLCLDNESNIVAWLVDQYRRFLDEEAFQKEVGSFVGLLEDVRYSDMLHAVNYYSSIFCLIQTVAIKRFNMAMLPELETRMVERVHAQLKDYIQLEEMRKKDETQKKEMPKLPKNIRFEVAAEPEGTVVERMQLLMFECEQARRFIAKALKESNTSTGK